MIIVKALSWTSPAFSSSRSWNSAAALSCTGKIFVHKCLLFKGHSLILNLIFICATAFAVLEVLEFTLPHLPKRAMVFPS